MINSRQAINNTLNHKKSSKLPIDFGSTGVTGISASIVSKLRKFYGLNSQPVKVIEPYEMLGEIDDELRKILGIDCIELSGKNNIFGFENDDWKEWKLFDGTEVLVPGKFNTDVNSDGTIYQYPQGDKNVPPSAKMPKQGYYFDSIIRKNNNSKDLKLEDNLEEFKIFNDKDIADIKRKAEALYNKNCAIVASFGISSFGDIALVPGPSLKNPKGIRDIEEWYISLIANKNHIYKLFSKQCDISLENYSKVYKEIGDKISVVFSSGTDFGTQRATLISKKTYMELFKPFHKKVNNWIHKNTNWKTFLHSCGAIEPLISEFIDAEFDILNPIQTSAEGMDPIKLVKKYGKDLVFWGGGIDTQKTLPFGTKKEVIDQVKRRIEIFNINGGFVFSAIHNIQANTPIENVVAMFETIKNM